MNLGANMDKDKGFPSPAAYAANNRGAVRPGEYLILPFDNRCSSSHSNFRDTDETVFVTKRFGADYVMSELVLREDGGTIRPLKSPLEHFIYVLAGQVKLEVLDQTILLDEGGFAWLPPETPFELLQSEFLVSRILWFRKPYKLLKGVEIPHPVFGNEKNIEAIKEVDINPEKQLLPYTIPGFDMAFNLIVCQPGGYYGLVESHAWEHAMYILDGEGILILNNEYHQVIKDDFIHIYPYCPEWFCASGMDQKPVRLLLYWDCNRDYENEFM